ncbi:hypothetical protein, partial [Oleiphilus sp. HI0128]
SPVTMVKKLFSNIKGSFENILTGKDNLILENMKAKIPTQSSTTKIKSVLPGFTKFMCGPKNTIIIRGTK